MITEDYMDISSLEGVLIRLNKIILKKKSQLQNYCEVCQELFHPWPVKSKEKQNELSCVKLPETSSTTKASVWTSEELDVVAHVDKLLSKARKISNVPRKAGSLENQVMENEVCLEKKPAGAERVNASIGLEGKEHLQPVQSCLTAPEGNRDKALEHLPYIADKIYTGKRSEDINTPLLQSSRVLLSSELREKQERDMPLKRSNSKQTTSMSSGVKSSQRSAGSSSASSVKSNRNSSIKKSSVKPAHMLAPFKTDPNICMASRKTNFDLASRKARCVSSKIHAQQRNRSAKAANSIKGSNHQSSNRIEMEKVSQEEALTIGYEPVEESVNESSNQYILDSTTDKCIKEDQNLSSNCLENVEKPVGVVENGAKGHDINSAREDQKHFLLVKDGKSLSVPIKLRQLYANNCRLREKLLNAMKTKKTNEADLGKAFVAKLDKQVELEPEVEKQQRFFRCHKEHMDLLKMLQNLELQTLSESKSPRKIMRAKMLVQYILLRFNELQDEVTLFLTRNPINTPENGLSQLTLTEADDVYSWFPPSGSSTGLPSAKSVVYQSSSQLRQYRHLQFQKQLHSFHIYLADQIAAHLFPQLTASVNSKDFVTLYRTTFSFLTSGGKHFPATVAYDT